MKLIIDIPENIIEGAKSSPNYYPTYQFEKIWGAIAAGTPYEETPKYFPPCEDCNKKMEEIRQAYDKMKAMETPQGEWVGNAFDEHHCSKCGHPALWEEEPDGYYEVQSRFCPTCGLPMDKGDTE